MPVNDRIAGYLDDMTAWRRHLHAHPETAFEEEATADFIAARLGEIGIGVHRGLAGTGVVGTLEAGEGPAIALRSDMDALDITEANDFAHKSTHQGKMHACGHDGHAAMLLGAARYLAESRDFKGSVHFIFQPAEENESGARVMIEEGLFDRFPVTAVFGMHNWPGIQVGGFAVRSGPMMAAVDTFEIVIKGKGAHAAMPHLGTDALMTAVEIAGGLSEIAVKGDRPEDSSVLSVTQFHSGETWNVIPDRAVVRGTARSFAPEMQDAIEARIQDISQSICGARSTACTIDYHRLYPPLINHPKETGIAVEAALQVAGEGNVDSDPEPTMGGEDFAFMLRQVPGCYVWIGNGPGGGGRNLHNPRYDFNDEILPIGASYWAKLAETILS